MLAERLRDREVVGGGDGVGTAEHELQAGRARAVRHADGAGKLNADERRTLDRGPDRDRNDTYKSPADMMCLAMKGFWDSMMSSMPLLAGYVISRSEKTTIEPSAPPLLMVSLEQEGRYTA